MGGTVMTRLTFFAALTLSLLVAAMKSDAQQKLRKNETYCLQSGGRSGGMSLRCRFETLAQCRAARVDRGDWCMQNPAIGFNKRG
jgi:hypothetical protein